ncbi:hypothetical protein Ancab_023666 [Ancistrocladus abbreviatus]
MGEWREGRWCWNLIWNRELLQREEQAVDVFLDFISDRQPNNAIEDGWRWEHSKSGGYTAKSGFDLLQGPPPQAIDMQWQDSCEHGSLSDVIEDRDETKAAVAQPAGNVICNNSDQKSEQAAIRFSKESSITHFNILKESSITHLECSQGEKPGELHACKSSAPDFSFPNSQKLRNAWKTIPVIHLHRLQIEHHALMPVAGSHRLEGVLNALQQAKTLLNQQISSLPLVKDGPLRTAAEPFVSSSRDLDRVKIPVGCAGLFRVPMHV